jgi:acyl carrier protein
MAQDIKQAPQQKVLVAYFVPISGQQPTVENLRAFLSKKLPDYMIPAAFVRLEAIPLTPNGKANRRALPLPDLARPLLEQIYVAPRNETEVELTNIWSDVLRIERVGIYDNFFELGGHSLLATQAIARIQQKFQIDLPLYTLFEAPTVATFAERVAQREIEQFDPETLAQLLTTLEEE